MRMNDLLVMTILCAVILAAYIYRRYTRSALNEKLCSAKRSHIKATELLQDMGYTIIDCDRRLQLSSIIDGKLYTDFLGVDFLAKKGRGRYLVKIASGGQSSRLGYRENREALIGLCAVFGCPNLLLVDPERRQIRVLKSIVKKPLSERFSNLIILGCVFLLGAAGSLVLRHLFNS